MRCFGYCHESTCLFYKEVLCHWNNCKQGDKFEFFECYILQKVLEHSKKEENNEEPVKKKVTEMFGKHGNSAETTRKKRMEFLETILHGRACYGVNCAWKECHVYRNLWMHMIDCNRKMIKPKLLEERYECEYTLCLKARQIYYDYLLEQESKYRIAIKPIKKR